MAKLRYVRRPITQNSEFRKAGILKNFPRLQLTLPHYQTFPGSVQAMKWFNLKHHQTKHSFQAVSFTTVVNTLPKWQVGTAGAKVCIWPLQQFTWAATLCSRSLAELEGEKAAQSDGMQVFFLQCLTDNFKLCIFKTCCSSNIAVKYVMLPTWWLSQHCKFLLFLLFLIVWLTDTVTGKRESSGLIIILQNQNG